MSHIADLVRILEKECKDSRSADLVEIRKMGCKDPLTGELVQIIKGEWAEFKKEGYEGRFYCF